MMPDFRDFPLGLNHVPVQPSPHLTGVLAMPTIPAVVDLFGQAREIAGVTICDGDALGNADLSCCVPAGAYRAVQIMRAITAGDTRKPTADQVAVLYRLWGGWDGTPATDLGTNSDKAGAMWMRYGIPWGDQFEDVPQVVPLGIASLRPAMAFLGPVQLDLALPIAWQTTSLWDAVDGPEGEPGSWGAHRVCGAGYGPYLTSLVTWGEEVNITAAGLAKYALGCWACVSRSWLDATGKTPAGLDWDTLAAEGLRMAG